MRTSPCSTLGQLHYSPPALNEFAFVTNVTTQGLSLSRFETSTPRTLICCSSRHSSLKTTLTVAASSAVLGPLLDNYHSQFHVLSYKNPIELHLDLLGQIPIDFATAPFTPPLFVVAGLIISTGTVWINKSFTEPRKMSIPHALATIAAFSAIYYLSAYLPCTMATVVTGPVLLLLALMQWYVLDGRPGGLVMGLLAALAGPAIEIALINVWNLYSYARPEFLGVPLFIAPVYFAGGSAVGNLALAVESIVESNEVGEMGE